MQFKIATVTILVASVLAAPQISSPVNKPTVGYPWSVPSGTTIGHAGDACGKNLNLSCCNKVDQSGDSFNAASGILSGVLGGTLSGKDGLGLFDGCSKLDVPVGIVGGGVGDLLNSQCKQTAACCQHSGEEQNGLLNVGIPCVALGGLL